MSRIPRLMPSRAEWPRASLKNESWRNTAKLPSSPPRPPVSKPPSRARRMKGCSSTAPKASDVTMPIHPPKAATSWAPLRRITSK
ncbi:MAG: hypothetical protein ACK55Z_19830 [bacterium]